MDNKEKITYLYDTFKNINGKFLQFWIENDEFQQAILSLMQNHIAIDDKVLLDTMSYIFDEKMAAQERGLDVNFNFVWASRAIKKLKALSK